MKLSAHFGQKKQWLASLVLAVGAIGVACATSPLGRRQLIAVPDAQLDQMGAQSFQQMKSETPSNSDPAINAYVHCVTDPITRAARDQTKISSWEVVVFKDATANAFALPGGKIGVHDGILKVAKTDAQLAAVLGHEVGHVIARHGAERVSQQVATSGGIGLISSFLGGQSNSATSQLLMAGLGMGAQVGLLLPWGRTQESEADLIGEDLMARAGFDPRQSTELWKNMKAASGGSAPPQWLSTHPADDTRIANLEKHMGDAVTKYNQARASGNAPSCTPPRL
jgi:predicted Zn-dependent protease